ncbi:hypothetical protein LCL95_08780 [Bacillus timonensis]|nr:hypothetical protein [Bacillus timonensis]
MSRRKPKVIHVDKLIVKAKEVVILDEGRKRRFDPWLGRRIDDDIDVDVDVDVKTDGDDIEVDVDVDIDREDDKRRPFSWI